MLLPSQSPSVIIGFSCDPSKVMQDTTLYKWLLCYAMHKELGVLSKLNLWLLLPCPQAGVRYRARSTEQGQRQGIITSASFVLGYNANVMGNPRQAPPSRLTQGIFMGKGFVHQNPYPAISFHCQNPHPKDRYFYNL